MSQLSKLMQVTEEERKKILEEHHVTEEGMSESVKVLKRWIKQNENFPPDSVFEENHLKVILLNAKMSLERAKKSLEGYLTVKTLYEDFFQRLTPDEAFRKTNDLSKNIIMPKLLPDLCRLHISKVTDQQGMASDGFDYYVMVMMLAEMRISKDFFLSTEILIDMQEFNLKNLLRFTPSVNTKLAHFLTAINLRVHRIHIVNTTPLWERAMFITRTMLPEKIMGKFVVHKTLEDLHKYIPKEYLPSNYGGTERPLEEIHDMWTEAMEANEEILQHMKTIKMKTVTKPENIYGGLGMGVEGSFRKLQLD